MPDIVNSFRKIISGNQYYEAHAGVYVGLNQVYFIKVSERAPDGLLIVTNPPESGQKKKVKRVEAKVEPDLVYPLIRGKDMKKWYVEFKDRYVIVPHNPRTGQPYGLNEMITRFPNTFSYLNEYKDELKKRSIKPFLSLRNRIKEVKSQATKKQATKKQATKKMVAEELDKNFYILDNIGTYTFAPYKVVWKEVSARMTVGGFHVAVVEPLQDKYLGENTVVPDHTVVLIPVENKDKAYYLAGILNSTIITFALQYAVVESISNLNIPKFDPNNDLHRRIAELSRRAHEVAKCIYAETKPDYCNNIRNPEKELEEIEKELDKAVAKLYDINEDALNDFRKLIAILSSEEVPIESPSSFDN